jgi:hypothetical protein
MEDEEIKKEEHAKDPPPALTGRAAILEAYKAARPDIQDDPDDDALWGFAHDRHNQVSGVNTKLSERISQDPRAGLMLNQFVSEGKSLPYAMSNIFGRDWLDGDAEEFEAGYQEHLKRLSESKAEQEQAAKNIQEYQKNLEIFAKENGLDETQAAQLNDTIYDDAENFLMGIIPIEFIDYKWKGLNYDKDVQEAAITGEVEGRNAAIDMKKKKTPAAPLPDMASGSGAGKPRTAPKPRQGKRDFFSELKDV